VKRAVGLRNPFASAASVLQVFAFTLYAPEQARMFRDLN
jgi:hypothetical protein